MITLTLNELEEIINRFRATDKKLEVLQAEEFEYENNQRLRIIRGDDQ